MSKWEVNIKGTYETHHFEISVVTENNLHGKQSYGWFDKDKLLISHNGGPYDCPVTKQVWYKLIKVAHEIVEELNRCER
jgi:hypothetical protein